jgi:hypothetical protein
MGQFWDSAVNNEVELARRKLFDRRNLYEQQIKV